MEAKLYMHRDFNVKALRIVELLEKCNVSLHIVVKDPDIDFDIFSEEIGHTVKRLPKVIIDGEYVGGYYDLVEYLVIRKIINFSGEILNDNKSATAERS
jgi:hypothetical protein